MVRLTEQIIKTPLKRLIALVLLGFFSCGLAVTAQAQFASDPCDPNYYESLEARAWLEAQREITQNQNLIFKSDSVLEYTCFDRYLTELAAHARDMFSESNRWGSSAGNMGRSLSNVLGSALSSYDSSNFDHNLLGGRSRSAYNLNGNISRGSYSCNTMDQVWRLAKCMDFIDQASYSGTAARDNDAFFTFAEYAADPDKRFLPSRCGGANQYQNNIDRATVDASTPWAEDSVVTYLDYIYPASGGAGSQCGGAASAISTGLLIERSTPDNGTVSRYGEKICVVPGCFFVPSGDYPNASITSGAIQGGRCCPYSGGGAGCP